MTGCAPARTPSRTLRLSTVADRPWVFRAVAALTVAPIVATAIRFGLDGWIPVNDAAPTVIRSKYALTFHPTLVGMFTDASGWIHASTFFAGPWQLWWMSLPIRVLGFTWGPLLSMAALNSCWILLAGFCVRRAFGRPTAIAALGSLALLLWSIGFGMAVTPVPMAMVLPGFAAFVMIAWAVAAGDDRSIWAMAVIGNFLVLDHLVLSRLVPSIALAALCCWGFWVIRVRSRNPAGWPGRRRRAIGTLAIGAGLTLVAWTPSIIQEITNDPGNLTNLVRANAARPGSSSSLADAALDCCGTLHPATLLVPRHQVHRLPQ